jgi:hypothetical protein
MGTSARAAVLESWFAHPAAQSDAERAMMRKCLVTSSTTVATRGGSPGDAHRHERDRQRHVSAIEPVRVSVSMPKGGRSMLRMRATLVLVTAALLVGCSSSASDTQNHSSSSPPVSQQPSAPTSPPPSTNHLGHSGTCLVTHTWQAAARARLPAGLGTANLVGPGPVYPGVYTPQQLWRRQTVVEMDDPRHFVQNFDMSKPKGWLVQKVLWKISRDYQGPVWIEGHEVGGPARMKFSDGGEVSRMLHFHARGSWPSESFVPHAGCYAWHIRGRGFHTVLAFRAVCVAGSGFRRCA